MFLIPHKIDVFADLFPSVTDWKYVRTWLTVIESSRIGDAEQTLDHLVYWQPYD